MTKNFDVNIESQTPNFDSLAKKVWDKIKSWTDFISEKMPQIENFCTNHEQALIMFCESPKWFQNILTVHNILPPNSEIHENKDS